MQLQVEPSENKEEVWKMFDQISSTYDTVNRAMTGGLDIIWRKNVAKLVPKDRMIELLDLATGTGDQLFSILKANKNISSADARSGPEKKKRPSPKRQNLVSKSKRARHPLPR